MSQITGNEPATGFCFVMDNLEGCCEYKGLTIRQELAARAMQSLILVHDKKLRPVDSERESFNAFVAKRSVQMADALIEALNENL